MVPDFNLRGQFTNNSTDKLKISQVFRHRVLCNCFSLFELNYDLQTSLFALLHFKLVYFTLHKIKTASNTQIEAEPPAFDVTRETSNH